MRIITVLFLVTISIAFFSCSSATQTTDPDPSTLTWNKLNVGTWLTFLRSYIDSSSKGVHLTSSEYTLEVRDTNQSIFGKNNLRQYFDTSIATAKYLAYDASGDISLLEIHTVNGIDIPQRWLTFPLKISDTAIVLSDTIIAPDANEFAVVTISYDGTENITVANHTFPCIRVKEKSDYFTVTASHDRTFGGVMYNWYAPEIGYFVKFSSNDTSFTLTGDISDRYYGSTKLIRYQIK
jgi:hypothetical protein